jgi:hypothetical protein
MKGSFVLLVGLVVLLTGCSASLERKELTRYENIAVICVLKNSVQFTEQGPLPIQIKQMAEPAPDWGIVESVQKSSHDMLSGQFNLVSLEYDSESLVPVFKERVYGFNWPNLLQKQILILKEMVGDKPVDAVVLIENGYIRLGEIKGVISGMGIFRRDSLFLAPRVQIHAILSGKIYETTNFKPVAYHDMAISEFRDFNEYPWSFGFSGMSEQANQEARATVRKTADEAVRKVLIELGLIEG